MHKLLIAVIFVICQILSVIACERQLEPRSYSNSLKTPGAVVEVFCDLDAAGKRLSSSTWSEMLPYIDWREEAGDSMVVIISGYKVSSIKTANNVANIYVEYAVIGQDWPDKSEPKKTIEKVSFTVIKTASGWKISSPDTIVPHVLPNSLISHFENVLRRESDPSAIEEIRDRIRMINNLTERNGK